MNKREFSSSGTLYTRISKVAARKAYNAGRAVYVAPVNYRPFGPWFTAPEIRNDSGATFDSYINSFEYYNCTLPEAGKYAAYYIAE